ncbi:MAG TPA: hypothetical protein VH439_17150 [Gemmatimonadales bacterium]|jgi:hypothetical protein
MSRDPLDVYVVYHDPSDYPGRFVVRRQRVTDVVVSDPEPLVVCDTLGEARSALLAAVPTGLYCLPRFPQDESQIVEAWI